METATMGNGMICLRTVPSLVTSAAVEITTVGVQYGPQVANAKLTLIGCWLIAEHLVEFVNPRNAWTRTQVVLPWLLRETATWSILGLISSQSALNLAITVSVATTQTPARRSPTEEIVNPLPTG